MPLKKVAEAVDTAAVVDMVAEAVALTSEEAVALTSAEAVAAAVEVVGTAAEAALAQALGRRYPVRLPGRLPAAMPCDRHPATLKFDPRPHIPAPTRL